MIKGDITKKLKQLTKAGWVVKTLNSNRRMASGMLGLTDHVLFFPRRGITVWAEVKIGNDHLNERQVAFKTMITGEKFYNNKTLYMLVTEQNIDLVINQLLKA